MSDNDREDRVALVTGGLRGLGKAMALGLAREGHPIVAVGHIESDIPEMEAEAEKMQLSRHFHPLAADLRDATECDRVVAATRERFGKARYPRQQRRTDLHVYRPGAVPPRQPATLLAGR